MRRTLLLIVGLAGLLAPTLARAADVPSLPKFTFKDGDRVVLIGDDLIERDQKYGYLETFLTLLNPDKSITFRNLGWSGDTVYGIARARFGSQADGFNHLKEHVLALKPTVLIVGYGMAESFDGEAGLPNFVSGLNALLDTLKPTKARVILLSPIAHLDLGRPLPDPTEHNKSLVLYAKAIRKVADERNYFYIDLIDLTSMVIQDPSIENSLKSVADDGIHLTNFGYCLIDFGIVTLLSPFDFFGDSDVGVGYDGLVKPRDGSTAHVSKIEKTADGIKFLVGDEFLPAIEWPQSRPPGQLLGAVREVQVTGLPPGSYSLQIDGTPIVTASSSDWNQSVELKRDPALDQFKALRKTINEKNLLYFHRWRPENETYLFGFRKHEQGNNAREIPLFDPLVEAKEKEIAKLRVPVSHVYELVRVKEEAK